MSDLISEGQLRALLNRTWPVQKNGVERFFIERKAKVRRAKEKKRYADKKAKEAGLGNKLLGSHSLIDCSQWGKSLGKSGRRGWPLSQRVEKSIRHLRQADFHSSQTTQDFGEW